MNFYDAMQQALENEKGMSRKGWPEGIEIRIEHIKEPFYAKVNRGTSHRIHRNWNPTPEDLMADDWELTKE